MLHEGYNGRDQLVPEEFTDSLQSFAIFRMLIGAARVFVEAGSPVGTAVIVLLGITGFIALAAFQTDIEANTSCKRALRERMREFEHSLGMSHWKTLAERKTFWIEHLVSFRPVRREGRASRSAATVFVGAGRTLLIAWPRWPSSRSRSHRTADGARSPPIR